MGPFADNGTVKKIIQEWGIWDKKTEKKNSFILFPPKSRIQK